MERERGREMQISRRAAREYMRAALAHPSFWICLDSAMPEHKNLEMIPGHCQVSEQTPVLKSDSLLAGAYCCYHMRVPVQVTGEATNPPHLNRCVPCYQERVQLQACPIVLKQCANKNIQDCVQYALLYHRIQPPVDEL